MAYYCSVGVSSTGAFVMLMTVVSFTGCVTGVVTLDTSGVFSIASSVTAGTSSTTGAEYTLTNNNKTKIKITISRTLHLSQSSH